MWFFAKEVRQIKDQENNWTCNSEFKFLGKYSKPMFLTRNITCQKKQKKSIEKGIKVGFRLGITAVTEGSGYRHCTRRL